MYTIRDLELEIYELKSKLQVHLDRENFLSQVIEAISEERDSITNSLKLQKTQNQLRQEANLIAMYQRLTFGLEAELRNRKTALATV